MRRVVADGWPLTEPFVEELVVTAVVRSIEMESVTRTVVAAPSDTPDLELPVSALPSS